MALTGARSRTSRRNPVRAVSGADGHHDHSGSRGAGSSRKHILVIISGRALVTPDHRFAAAGSASPRIAVEVGLLNVAVSRAQELLYVIGARSVWKRAGVFLTLHELLPQVEL